jgi:hypothetical protein
LQLLLLQNFQQSQGCSSLKHPTNNQWFGEGVTSAGMACVWFTWMINYLLHNESQKHNKNWFSVFQPLKFTLIMSSIGTIPTDDLNPMFFITQKWIKFWAENWILKHSCWWQCATTGFELWTKLYTKFRSGEYSRVNWAKTLCAINLPLSSPAWTSFLLLNSLNFLLLHMATGHSLIAAHLLLKEGDNIAWKIVWIKRLR